MVFDSDNLMLNKKNYFVLTICRLRIAFFGGKLTEMFYTISGCNGCDNFSNTVVACYMAELAGL